MEITLNELADLVGGVILSGDGGMKITGFAAIADAGEGDLTFFGNERYLNALKTCRAAAVLVPEGFSIELSKIAGVVAVGSPSGAFTTVVQNYGAPERTFTPGVHPSAVIDPSVVIDPQKVSVKAHAVIGKRCTIGEGTEIGCGTVVGEGTKVGSGCLFHPNVTVREGAVIGDRVILHSGCVIGADGFGYEVVDGRYQKIEQVGTVELGDDVEIGACSTIDRARFGSTRIGEGTKLDNLVHIAHNCVIGKHTASAALVGVSGSARIGDHVMLAGRAGVNGHVKIADKVIVMGKSGVTKDILEPGKYMGFPAVKYGQQVKVLAAQRRLPELMERVRRLEKKLGELSGDSGA